jgi:hypothetical protein
MHWLAILFIPLETDFKSSIAPELLSKRLYTVTDTYRMPLQKLHIQCNELHMHVGQSASYNKKNVSRTEKHKKYRDP